MRAWLSSVQWKTRKMLSYRNQENFIYACQHREAIITGGEKTAGRAIIVGIDPGTTSSYAILDTEGKVIRVKSAKELGINTIISDVAGEGTVVAAGTDKRKCPAMVARFAAKTGARVISPDEDLGIIEKRALAAGRDYGNWHEMDALASAANAFNALRPLLKKIEKSLELRGKTSLKDEVMKLVITRRISINAALEELQAKQADSAEVPEEAALSSYDEAKSPETGKLAALAAQMRMLERTNDILKRHNNRLLNALKRGKAKNRKLMARISRKLEGKEIEGAFMRERLVEALRQRLADRDMELGRLRDELAASHSMLAGIKGRVVLKKLDNLTWDEYLRKDKIIGIKEGDALLVGNPGIYDERAVAALREKVSLVLHRERISSRLKDSLGFAFVDGDGIDFAEDRFFAVADRAGLEEKKARAGMLASIVGSYRKERQSEVLVHKAER
ncbi:DUF460 domain-containing protein [Candidatus Woesearchaeota archaeon]|nr:DUF460 domain-containing protein [Candidatus Woesearchaeota archaeon]